MQENGATPDFLACMVQEKLTGGEVACPASGSCETILSSGYATVLGIPLSLIGKSCGFMCSSAFPDAFIFNLCVFWTVRVGMTSLPNALTCSTQILTSVKSQTGIIRREIIEKLCHRLSGLWRGCRPCRLAVPQAREGKGKAGEIGRAWRRNSACFNQRMPVVSCPPLRGIIMISICFCKWKSEIASVHFVSVRTSMLMWKGNAFYIASMCKQHILDCSNYLLLQGLSKGMALSSKLHHGTELQRGFSRGQKIDIRISFAVLICILWQVPTTDTIPRAELYMVPVFSGLVVQHILCSLLRLSAQVSFPRPQQDCSHGLPASRNLFDPHRIRSTAQTCVSEFSSHDDCQMDNFDCLQKLREKVSVYPYCTLSGQVLLPGS